MTKDTLQIQIKSVYGRTVAYPMNAVAEHIAAIADTRTLTPHTLRHAFEAGFTIEVLDCFGGIAKTFTPHGDDMPGDVQTLNALVM